MVSFTALNVAQTLPQSPAASATSQQTAPTSPRNTTTSVRHSPSVSPTHNAGVLQASRVGESPKDVDLNYQTIGTVTHHEHQLPPISQQVPRYEQAQQPSPVPSVSKPVFIQPRSPSMRRDTASSTSSQGNTTSRNSNAANNTSRRTGPLSQVSRDRAALIRKLGACRDCKKRRVACHPGHHNLTWEQVQEKFRRSISPPAVLELVRPWMVGPTFSNAQQDSHEMDIDTETRQSHPVQPESLDERSQRGSFSDTQRKPLPGGRVERPVSHMESVKNELQTQVSQMLSTNSRTRYRSAEVVLALWEDDDDFAAVNAAVKELADVFGQYYHYTVQVVHIPSMSDASKSPERWLSRKLHDFVEHNDQRDVLKIFLYAGHSALDANREMVLARYVDYEQARGTYTELGCSSKDSLKVSVIRWAALQQILEGACSDILVLLDSAYFPTMRVVRNKGVLEIIAASTSARHQSSTTRYNFTRAVADQLQKCGIRCTPFSAAELHASLMSIPQTAEDVDSPQNASESSTAPVHVMASGNLRFPSIFLAPTYARASLRSSSYGYENNPQLQLSIRLKDENIDVDAWTEWLRLMPEGVKDMRVEALVRGAYR